MRFNFLLFNHTIAGAAQLADVVRPILYGLVESGHEATAGITASDPEPVQLIVERFIEPSVIARMQEMRKFGVRTGLVLTRDGRAIAQDPDGAQRLHGLQQVLPCFDFVWSTAVPDTYGDLLQPLPVTHLKIGSYSGGLGQWPLPRDEGPVWDFLIYGRQSPRRLHWQAMLKAMNFRSHFSFARMAEEYPLPDYVLDIQTASSRMMLDVAGSDAPFGIRPEKLSMALQNGLPILCDHAFDLAGSIYDGFVEQVSLDDLQTRGADFLESFYATIAIERARAWRRDFPMSKLLEPAVESAAEAARVKT